MARGLLLGNGINSHLGIKDLSTNCIGERFKKNVSAYATIINSIFGVQITADFLTEIGKQTFELGIEKSAAFLYNYIRECNNKGWTDNDEIRLQDLITCICLTSIFYDENGIIRHEYNKSKMLFIENYDYIFTLNYFEFWDDENRCIHLHGKIELSELRDKRNVILVSKVWSNNNKYATAIDAVRKTHNVIGSNLTDIVFAPSVLEKNKLVCVAGIYPSEKLYPADDLFLHKSKELYKALDLVDELDIFGMSPYGDD